MKKRATLFAGISAACYILYFLLNLCIYKTIEFHSIPLTVFCIMMLLQRKNIVMFSTWFLFVVIASIGYIELIINGIRGYNVIVTIIPGLLGIAYLVLMTINLSFVCLPKLEGKTEKLATLWFVPIILYVSRWGIGIYPQIPYLFYNRLNLIKFIMNMLVVVHTIFQCLWLRQRIDKPNQKKKVIAPNSQIEPTLSQADKLLQYKELLDSGAISQEEFDAKKKQVLGL